VIDEFDPIAERIAREEALASAERHFLDDLVPGVRQADPERMKIGNRDGDVRLSSRPEVGVDANVQLLVAELEPATAAPMHFLGLGNFC
jgi:hypothetical protein